MERTDIWDDADRLGNHGLVLGHSGRRSLVPLRTALSPHGAAVVRGALQGLAGQTVGRTQG